MRVTPELTVDESAIEERFVQSAGPGGQNVNKVATAVELRFITHRAALPESVYQRLLKLAGRRISADGVLVIQAQRYRSQARNRDDARQRLRDLLRAAATAPKPRRPTRPTRASVRRRLEDKRQTAERKRARQKPERE